ncbi:MAG: peptide chain release factor N(5)-glutamine methyltransferase [Chloroflexi bacterium]|nr:MAG: peptide chain release factor N(5)-glutamine methyltransferase [Chloroflexota bacterium]
MPPAEALRSADRLVADAAARLRDIGSPSARLDAELLVSHAFGRDRAWLHAHPEATLDQPGGALLDGWLARRAAGEPVAYIRGFKDWFSLRLRTDPRALIPRPETELLVEAAISEIAARLVRDAEPIVAWDVGTGSGAVALAVALRFRAALTLRRLRLVASDLSADALELAAENLAASRAADLVTLAAADLLDGAGRDPLPRPGIVIGNLPYVRTAEVELGTGSLAWEPRGALDGGADGLDVVRRLLGQLPGALDRDGVALLEIGAGQADAVRAAVDELPMRTVVTALPDLAGVERVVRVARL